jgi:hypothetical protein
VNIGELAIALNDFFLHPGICEKMGEAARQRFDEHYDYKVVIDKLETFWLKLKENFAPEKIKKNSVPMFPDFFHAFSHYFTQLLSPEVYVRCTDFARNLLEIDGNYPLFADMEQWVNRENIRKIIIYTAEPKKMEKVIAYIIEDERKRVHYQILWMLKHGLLEII